MNVFLIQTNGRDITDEANPEYVRGAKGPRFVDEPLQHHRYFNADPYWKWEGYGRRDTWHAATAGDTALLYCASSVDEHGACLSHVLPIADERIDPEGALLRFERPRELEPKIGYGEIQRLVDEGVFSERMGYCGQKGFDVTQGRTRTSAGSESGRTRCERSRHPDGETGEPVRPY